ncbi:MAG TPA: hypothetical protein VHJ20_02670 [Polyangia bacterium]|nr:hypothetical protein [Polyangia bacterium]
MVVALALVVVGRGAAAQDGPPADATKQQVRALYDRATTEYRLGYFTEAAQLYEDAYRIVHDPALLYDMGQAWRMAGRPDKAFYAYRSYVRTAPADAPNLELARKHMDELAPAATTPTPPPTLPAPPHKSIDTRQEGLLPSAPAPSSTSVTHRAWLWGLLGAVVAGALVTTVVLADRPREPTAGSVGTAVVP